MSLAAEDNTQEALARQLREGGLVVLSEPLSKDFVLTLRDAFLPLLTKHVTVADPNRGQQRYQMYLPFEPPFSDPALWADPGVLAIVEKVLGPDFECIYEASDTPFPGSDYQPVHQDCGHLFPEWDQRLPPFCVVMNVSLVDVDEENGPLEWFPGFERPDPDAVPEKFTGPAGTLLLRDPRVWHRGSSNTSTSPRPTIALIYARSWYRYHLNRPVIDRALYESLPDPGGRLFRGADVVPAERVVADGPATFD